MSDEAKRWERSGAFILGAGPWEARVDLTEFRGPDGAIVRPPRGYPIYIDGPVTIVDDETFDEGGA